MSYQEHRRLSEQITARCGVITLSDTRTVENDQSGRKIRELLIESKHAVVDYQLMPDHPDRLRTAIYQLLDREDVDAIITNGGTGVSRRDQTVGVVEAALDYQLSGFGELFRMLSWQEIGSGAMLSRAVAGVARGKVIFALPGSTKAVELAMTRLILPEIGHILGELRK